MMQTLWRLPFEQDFCLNRNFFPVPVLIILMRFYMQHTNRVGLALRKLLICYFLLAAFSFTAAAQKDTTKRNIIGNILNRITGKDTVKPVTQPNRNPVNQPDRNITARDTVPVRVNPNIIDNNVIVAQLKYPDTLVIGAYTIVVEEY